MFGCPAMQLWLWARTALPLSLLQRHHLYSVTLSGRHKFLIRAKSQLALPETSARAGGRHVRHSTSP
uniref:Secreted protein n=1 Tax=Ixodes ricinus TaxID=34613 RepID=A0A6B0TQM9_IXORI